MPSKWSGSEGTDVARKFTDIRILEGLYMNAFHGVLWITHKNNIYSFFLVPLSPICYDNLGKSIGKLDVDFRSVPALCLQ